MSGNKALPFIFNCQCTVRTYLQKFVLIHYAHFSNWLFLLTDFSGNLLFLNMPLGTEIFGNKDITKWLYGVYKAMSKEEIFIKKWVEIVSVKEVMN